MSIGVSQNARILRGANFYLVVQSIGRSLLNMTRSVEIRWDEASHLLHRNQDKMFDVFNLCLPMRLISEITLAHFSGCRSHTGVSNDCDGLNRDHDQPMHDSTVVQL